MGRLTQADLEGHYHDEWSKQIDKWIYAYPDCYMAAARGACKDGIHLIFYEKLRKVDSDENVRARLAFLAST